MFVVAGFTAIVLLIAFPYAGAGAGACPLSCRCDRRRTVYCNERQLVLIPYGIPDNTQTLRLQINNITNGMQVDSILSSLNSLSKLDLHQNKLTSVPKGLPNSLKIVDFRSNDIKFVGKSSFRGLTLLEELHLDGNNIENQGLSSSAFTSTDSLEVLVLSNNLLERFPENLPASLRVLRLENNRIRVITVEATRRLNNLINLDLSQNAIAQTRIEPDAMVALSSLLTLDMSRNLLSEVPPGLSASVQELMLSHNKIEYIFNDADEKRGSLKALSNVRRVDLSWNQLKSVESLAFSTSHINSIELQDNPWQCDCYLRYLKRWLGSDVSTLSSESNIRCHSPSAFSGVTLNSIDEEALVCHSRTEARKRMKIANVSSTGFHLLWKGSPEMPDPAFIRRSLLYGPLKCGNCSVEDLSPSGFRTSAEAVSFMKKYSSQDFIDAPSQQPLDSIVKVDRLDPDTRYAVCVFDSQQSDADVSIDQCVNVHTSSLVTVASPHNEQNLLLPIWIFVLCGVLLLIAISAIVGFIIWKKTKALKSKTPRLYPANGTHYLSPDRCIPGYGEEVAYRTTLAHGYETSRSDRTYAECGPAGTAPRTVRDSAVDARMEFEVLIKSNEVTAPKRIQTPINSLCSECQENSTMSTSQTGRCSSARQQNGSSPPPTYDSLHSYTPSIEQRPTADPLPNGQPDPSAGSYV